MYLHNLLRILPQQNTALLSHVLPCVSPSTEVTSHFFTFITCIRPCKPYIFWNLLTATIHLPLDDHLVTTWGPFGDHLVTTSSFLAVSHRSSPFITVSQCFSLAHKVSVWKTQNPHSLLCLVSLHLVCPMDFYFRPMDSVHSSKVKGRFWKNCLLVFLSHFSVCFKCKIRFRTYGIHRNI